MRPVISTVVDVPLNTKTEPSPKVGLVASVKSVLLMVYDPDGVPVIVLVFTATKKPSKQKSGAVQDAVILVEKGVNDKL